MADEEKKEEPKPPVKPGEQAGRWIDTSYQEGESGRWVQNGMWVVDEKRDFGPAPGPGWVPFVTPYDGKFAGWANSSLGNEHGPALVAYDAEGKLGQPGLTREEKGQYGYGSKRKQKFNRLFTYFVKGALVAMAGWGAGAAAGLWGAGAASGAGTAGGAAGAGEGLIPLGEGAVAETGAAEGALGGPAVGEGAKAAPAWMKWAKMANQAKDMIPSGGSNAYQYQEPESDIQQYETDDDQQLRARADELRARIAALRGNING